MKDLLVYIAVGIILLSLVGGYVSSGAKPGETLAVSAAAENNSAVSAQVGVLLNSVSTLEEVYFKETLKENMPDGCSVHFSDASGNAQTQLDMLRRMLSDGYGVIFLELFPESDAAQCVELAKLEDVPLVFLGDEPTQEVMDSWEKLYYLGFADSNDYETAAEALRSIFLSNRNVLDKDQDGVISYSVLSTSAFTGSENKRRFDAVFEERNLSASLVTDAVTESFEYYIYRELRGIAKTDTELLICASSNDAAVAAEYFSDTEAFDTLPDIEIAVLTLDDGSRNLVDSGQAILAVGTDGTQLGAVGAKLANLLLSGAAPTAETLGTAMDGRSVRIARTVLVSSYAKAVNAAVPVVDAR